MGEDGRDERGQVKMERISYNEAHVWLVGGARDEREMGENGRDEREDRSHPKLAQNHHN